MNPLLLKYKKSLLQLLYFRPGLWHKARKMTLTAGQTDVKVSVGFLNV